MELPKGTFIKLQPHLTEFINNPNPKTILEYNLRNYFCVTEGDTISVKFGKKIFKIDIVNCKPGKGIRTLNCDIVVDFDPPKDYKEPPRQAKNQINSSTSGNIKFKNEEKQQRKKLTPEELQKQIEDKKFSGHHFRMDGKVISENQINKVKVQHEKKNAEENYDPRKCKIPSTPRPEFRYVEL